MKYRWKPNRAQRQAYKERMQERGTLSTIKSNGAIRKGCYVKYYNTNRGEIIDGVVTGSSYGKDKGQHTFTIGGIKVKGRNLYPNLIEHVQGEDSKLVSRH